MTASMAFARKKGRRKRRKQRVSKLHLVVLVGACLATCDRIFATGSDSVSKIVLRSCGCLCLISVHTIMVWKGPRSPKHIATIALCDPIFHPDSLLLGRDPCGDRILRSCLQKGPATTPANYAHGFQDSCGFQSENWSTPFQHSDV